MKRIMHYILTVFMFLHLINPAAYARQYGNGDKYSELALSVHPRTGVLTRGLLMIKAVTKGKENKIYKAPSKNSDVEETVGALRIFFVFPAVEKKPELTKNDFYHVAWSPKTSDMAGWIHKDHVVEWNHREMAKFTSLAGREQALIFKSTDDLIRSTVNEDKSLEMAISREPASASKQRQDVLLPILQQKMLNTSGEILATYEIAYLHKAGVTGGRPEAGTRLKDNYNSTELVSEIEKKVLSASFKLDIMFVMDMTSGMQPEINGISPVVKHLAREAGKFKEVGGLRVGLVGYRDRIADQGAIGFVVNRFSPLTDNIEDFLDILRTVKEARVSSEDYPESMYDGVLDAIEKTRWSDNGLRIIVLIGDAEAHEPGSPKNPENISKEQLIMKAKEKRIRICALKKILFGDIELQRAQLKALVSGAGPKNIGTYGEYKDIKQYIEAVKHLLTNELNRLHDLIKAHVNIAKTSAKTSGGKVVTPTPQSTEDYIIFDKINKSATEVLIKGGRNPNEPVFSTGWIAQKQGDKDVIQPHVLMSGTELQVVSIFLRGIRAGADSNQDIWSAIESSIAQLTGESRALERGKKISEIMRKKHGLPIVSNLLSFTIDEMKTWTIQTRKDILDKINRKLQLIDGISSDPSKFTKQGSGSYRITYVPLGYLP